MEAALLDNGCPHGCATLAPHQSAPVNLPTWLGRVEVTSAVDQRLMSAIGRIYEAFLEVVLCTGLSRRERLAMVFWHCTCLQS